VDVTPSPWRRRVDATTIALTVITLVLLVAVLTVLG
jgi:hypothetical protein